MEAKKNYMITSTYTITKTDTYLVNSETKEDAIYIVENQNNTSSCQLYNETESDPEDESNTVKEVTFEKNKDGYYWKEIGENNDK
tara:strand:- start:230 stop:484 length:255 start_codon:yes stop_codon:yes gene_type:complete